MLGSIPSLSIFNFMLLKVVPQVLKFFFVYAATLVAFSQMFYFLLVRDQEYADEGGNGIFDMPWTAFLKVLAMMIGEFDFGSSFTMDTIRQSSVMTSYNDFTLFIFPVLVQL